MIKEICTIHGIKIDSICATVWKPNAGGIKDIVAVPNGYNINWNLGYTFVPYSNVRYVEVRFR
jgi:hypothetical protein